MNNSFKILLLLVLVFVPLERLIGLKSSQKIFRAEWKSDLFHYFANTFLLQAGISFIIITLYIPLRKVIPLNTQEYIFHLHGGIQFVCIIILAEIGYYTAHRLAHKIPILWRFHQVHHSSTQMDWLATARFHPIDLILTWSITILPIIVLGFSAKIFAIYQTIWLFQNYLAHSNINWRFPFLSKILITPQNHHWHHSDDPKIYNNNFAGQLMFMDHLFGTFYNPAHKKPGKFGNGKSEKNNIFNHLINPFISNK